MRAAVFREPNNIEVQNIPAPTLKDKGAIIKVLGCGLCGSDIVKFKQNLIPDGTVLGHEITGIITEINAEKSNLKIGDKVVLGHHVPCFKCTYCKNQSYSMCREFKESNIVPGGFCEYIYVSEGHLNNTVYKIPDGLSEIEASFTEPAACCLRAVKRANVKTGDNVFIIGLGTIGLIMGQITRHYGAFTAGCDLINERLNLALETGFDKAIKYTNLEETASLYKLATNGIGADIVFLASGSLSSIPLALSAVRDGGTIVIFSSVSTSNGAFSNNDIYYRELTVMGSYSPAPADLCESLNLIKDSIIKVDKFAEIYQLNNITEAIDDTLSNKILKAYIKIAEDKQ